MRPKQDKKNKILQYFKTLNRDLFKNSTLEGFVQGFIKDTEVFNDKNGYDYDAIRSFCELIYDNLSKKQLKLKSLVKFFKPKKIESSLNNSRTVQDIKYLVKENSREQFVKQCIQECRNKFTKLEPDKVETIDVGVQNDPELEPDKVETIDVGVQNDPVEGGEEDKTLYDNLTIKDIKEIIKKKVCEFIPGGINSKDSRFKSEIFYAVKKLQALLKEEEDISSRQQSQYKGKDICDNILKIVGQEKFVTNEDLEKIFKNINSLLVNVDEISQNKVLDNDLLRRKNLDEITSELLNVSNAFHEFLENKQEENLQQLIFVNLKKLQISLTHYVKLLNSVESDFTKGDDDSEKYIKSLSELKDDIESIFSRNFYKNIDSSDIIIVLAKIDHLLCDRFIEGCLSETVEVQEKITKENLSLQIDKMREIILRHFNEIKEINSQEDKQKKFLISHKSKLLASYIDSFISSLEDATKDIAHISDEEFDNNLNHYIKKLKIVRQDELFIIQPLIPLIFRASELQNHLEQEEGSLYDKIVYFNNKAPATPPSKIAARGGDIVESSPKSPFQQAIKDIQGSSTSRIEESVMALTARLLQNDPPNKGRQL